MYICESCLGLFKGPLAKIIPVNVSKTYKEFYYSLEWDLRPKKTIYWLCGDCHKLLIHKPQKFIFEQQLGLRK